MNLISFLLSYCYNWATLVPQFQVKNSVSGLSKRKQEPSSYWRPSTDSLWWQHKSTSTKTCWLLKENARNKIWVLLRNVEISVHMVVHIWENVNSNDPNFKKEWLEKQIMNVK